MGPFKKYVTLFWPILDPPLPCAPPCFIWCHLVTQAKTRSLPGVIFNFQKTYLFMTFAAKFRSKMDKKMTCDI